LKIACEGGGVTWDEVEPKIVFWSQNAWVPDSNNQPGIVDDAGKIRTLLEQWYNGSDIAKAAIDKVIERYGVIRIGDRGAGGITIHGTATNDGYLLVDSDDTPHDHWLTPDGHWMESSLSVSLLHEVMHLGWQYEDPSHWAGAANQAFYEATMNGADYDYAGEVVDQVNAALAERGLEGQQRSSYQALLTADNANNAAFQTGVS
jgi:hypothetical protein